MERIRINRSIKEASKWRCLKLIKGILNGAYTESNSIGITNQGQTINVIKISDIEYRLI